MRIEMKRARIVIAGLGLALVPACTTPRPPLYGASVPREGKASRPVAKASVPERGLVAVKPKAPIDLPPRPAMDAVAKQPMPTKFL